MLPFKGGGRAGQRDRSGKLRYSTPSHPDLPRVPASCRARRTDPAGCELHARPGPSSGLRGQRGGGGAAPHGAGDRRRSAQARGPRSSAPWPPRCSTSGTDRCRTRRVAGRGRPALPRPAAGSSREGELAAFAASPGVARRRAAATPRPGGGHPVGGRGELRPLPRRLRDLGRTDEPPARRAATAARMLGQRGPGARPALGAPRAPPGRLRCPGGHQRPGAARGARRRRSRLHMRLLEGEARCGRCASGRELQVASRSVRAHRRSRSVRRHLGAPRTGSSTGCHPRRWRRSRWGRASSPSCSEPPG